MVNVKIYCTEIRPDFAKAVSILESKIDEEMNKGFTPISLTSIEEGSNLCVLLKLGK